MTKHQIVFGDRFIEADIPDQTQIVSPGISIPLPPVEDIEAEVQLALDGPLDLMPLRELARGRSRIVIAFDDATVPCYAPLWPAALPLIIRALDEAGVRRENTSLLCANALHRQFTNVELGKLIGDDVVNEFAGGIGCHDAEDPAGMVELGVTNQGFHVDLNKAVVDSDLTIYLNCSTTRGFSGGWKSICVGLSSYRSIAAHHTPDTMSMSIDRNRMHEILDEMGALVIDELGEDRIFKIETVLANPLEVAKIFGGSVDATRRAALKLNREHLPPRRTLLEEKTDVVMYGVPNWSPYASFSSMNPLLTLISTGLGYLGGMIEALGKPGCTVILATPCADQWDHDRHPSYKEVWDRVLPETKDPDVARSQYEAEFAARPEYIEKYRNGFGFHGSHGVMALYPLKRLRHAGRVIVAGAENPKLVEHVGFESAGSIEDALDMVGTNTGAPSVALVDYPMAVARQ